MSRSFDNVRMNLSKTYYLIVVKSIARLLSTYIRLLDTLIIHPRRRFGKVTLTAVQLKYIIQYNIIYFFCGRIFYK